MLSAPVEEIPYRAAPNLPIQRRMCHRAMVWIVGLEK